jgi:hypothetical protein
MTDAVRRRRRPVASQPRVAALSGASPTPSTNVAEGTAASERNMARRVAQVAPIVTVVAAATVGAMTSLGPAILVLAGGALFATIAFFWASLRTLGGDAPLAEGFAQMTRRRIEASDGAVERKRTALRALKDLEFEHSIGKIDDADYLEISTSYRDQAKAILREMEEEILPRRERAEQLARAYLAKRGVARASEDPGASKSLPLDTPVRVPRRECEGCKTSNEPDAMFCKGCGARLAAKDCPACATVNEKDASFCKKCGGSLGSPEKVDAST